MLCAFAPLTPQFFWSSFFFLRAICATYATISFGQVFLGVPFAPRHHALTPLIFSGAIISLVKFFFLVCHLRHLPHDFFSQVFFLVCHMRHLRHNIFGQVFLGVLFAPLKSRISFWSSFLGSAIYATYATISLGQVFLVCH